MYKTSVVQCRMTIFLFPTFSGGIKIDLIWNWAFGPSLPQFL